MAGPATRAFLLLLVLLPSAPARAGTMTDHEARLRRLDAAWKEAAAAHDLDGMMAIYAEDAREILPGMPPIVGREAIRDFYAGLMRTFPRFAHHFEAEEITVSASGDLAVVRGRYRFTPDREQPE